MSYLIWSGSSESLRTFLLQKNILRIFFIILTEETAVKKLAAKTNYLPYLACIRTQYWDTSIATLKNLKLIAPITLSTEDSDRLRTSQHRTATHERQAGYSGIKLYNAPHSKFIILSDKNFKSEVKKLLLENA